MKKRALQLARQLGCEGAGLSSVSQVSRQGYDIIINATPAAMPIEADQLIPGTVAMDMVVQPQYRPFLKAALERRCRLVFGYEMFVNQAVEQFQIWFGERIEPGQAKEFLQKSVLQNIRRE